MDYKKIGVWVSFFVAGLFAANYVHGLKSAKWDGQKDDKVNLALRQAADKMYRLRGDSTTSIPPVKKVSDRSFRLQLNSELRYETLPFLIRNALADYNIAEDYYVTIKSCESDTVFLGYSFLDLNTLAIPCLGRDEYLSTCNIVEIVFTEGKSSKLPIAFAGLFLVLAIKGLIPTKKEDEHFEKSEIDETVIENQDSKNEIINDGKLRLGNTIFDTANLYLIIGAEKKSLTFREGKLLEYFMSQPNQILKREDIQNHVWQEEGVIVGRSLDVFISRLRKLLKGDPSLKIANIHGVGYRLEDVHES